MIRGCRLTRAVAVAAAALALAQTPADAQWFYPNGYGPYGWGGWGASTAQGDIAHGLGAFAAGAGQYNAQTAVANSINLQTAIDFNQYMYQSQLEANRRQQQRMAARQQSVNETIDARMDRLRNRPTAADVARGDALNVIYDDLSDPRIYLRVVKAGKATIKGSLIRSIPFQYASAAITASVDDLTKRGAPEALRKPQFDDDRTELRALADKLREQNKDDGEYDKATLEKTQKKVLEVLAKVDNVYTKHSRDWNDSHRFLKGVYGLLRMLDTPAIDVLLAGVEKRPQASLAELLTFMESFNLRFGVASTPEQKLAYNTLYPMLKDLRDEALAGISAPPPSGPVDPSKAAAFFDAMDDKDLMRKPAPKGSGNRQ
jgi:hypothetical protein